MECDTPPTGQFHSVGKILSKRILISSIRLLIDKVTRIEQSSVINYLSGNSVMSVFSAIIPKFLRLNNC